MDAPLNAPGGGARTATPAARSAPCRVLIADDHEVTRQGFVQVFSALAEFSVCGEAATLPEMAALCSHLQPDLVIMDLSFGDQLGFAVLRRLSQSPGAPRFLVASMLDERVHGRAALELGARGFVSKAAGIAAITSAAECVRNGGLAVPPRLTSFLLPDRRTGTKFGSGRRRTLSNAEQVLLADLHSFGSPDAIANARGATKQTVYTQLYRIRKRLGLATLPQLREYAALRATYYGGAPTESVAASGTGDGAGGRVP